MHRGLILAVAVTVIVLFFNYGMSHDAKAQVQPVIKLDKSLYTWTDRVIIKVTAPDQNLDPNKADKIFVTISTRGNSISSYRLFETGPNTGIFAGYVILTGSPTLKGPDGVDGSGKQPTGAGPSGVGPIDGLIPAQDSDGISVTFQITPSNSVSASALIRWNVGQVTWLQPNNPSSKVLEIIDPDMNLDPNAVDTFLTPVFSDSDLAGVVVTMTETGPRSGIFLGAVHFTNSTSSGNRLHVSAGSNTITGRYVDRTLPAPYTPSDQIGIDAATTFTNANTPPPHAKIKLDKTAYTWTDRVLIIIIAPTQNLDPTKIDTIGDSNGNKVTISTRGNSISPYKLVETGPNTGIFVGYVVLTGDKTLKDQGGVDGNGQEPTGAGPSGVGIKDGLLPSEDNDGITVSYQLQKQTVVSTAPVLWNIGQVTWLQPSYTSGSQGTCSITDPDMNLNPLAIDKFSNNVWSDTDSGGIRLDMTETGQNTGIFQGVVLFTNSPSSGNQLHVSPNDNVTCEYKDRTIPSPYLPSDILRVTSDAAISTVTTIPTNLSITSSVNPSVFGQLVSFSITMQFPPGSPHAPSGSVSFFDGNTLFGTITVPPGSPPDSWNVSFDIGSLVVGSHSITAKYSGDVNFTSSNSMILTQTVNN